MPLEKPSQSDKINRWLYKTKGVKSSKGDEDLMKGPEWAGYEPAKDGRGLRVVGIRELTEDAEEWVVQRYVSSLRLMGVGRIAGAKMGEQGG